jgi:hypothetical protein
MPQVGPMKLVHSLVNSRQSSAIRRSNVTGVGTEIFEAETFLVKRIQLHLVMVILSATARNLIILVNLHNYKISKR